MTKKNIILLAIMSLCSSVSASEVWGNTNSQDDKDSIVYGGAIYSGYPGVDNIDELNKELKEGKEKVYAEGRTSLADKASRAKNALQAASQNYADFSLNIYAEYLYMQQKFVKNLTKVNSNVDFVRYSGDQDLAHHYPHAKMGKTFSGNNVVLPAAADKINLYLNDIYYAAKARDAVVDAMGVDNIRDNNGRIIYQSNDPDNSIDIETELDFSRQNNQTVSNYMNDKSAKMQKENSFLSNRRTSDAFGGILSKLQSSFTKQIQEIATSEAMASVPSSWNAANACRTLICLANGGAGGTGCAKQIPAYIQTTQGATPADTAAKKVAWFQMCSTAMAKYNIGTVLSDAIKEAQSIFNYNSSNGASGSLGMPESYLARINEDNASMGDFITYALLDVAEKCNMEQYNNTGYRKILFNWNDPTDKNLPTNPFFLVESKVKDDQLSALCQKYVDHPFLSVYTSPIYDRWTLARDYNKPKSDKEILFDNRWLSSTAFSDYKSKLNKQGSLVDAKTLFGEYYDKVPKTVIQMIDSGKYDRAKLTSLLNAASSTRELQTVRKSNSFEHFMDQSSAKKHPAYDFTGKKNYYYGEWKEIIEYINLDTLKNDADNQWDLVAIQQDVEKYGNELHGNTPETAKKQRKRNKEMMLNMIHDYKDSKD